MAPSTSNVSGGESNAPLEQRLVSKNWQIRANAYDELCDIFNQAQPADECFREYSGGWVKYLADSIPGALERCLDALNAFISNCDPKFLATVQNEIIKVLVEKCLGQNKPSIKSKSSECFLLIFEVSEQFAESEETMLELLKSKN